MHSLDEQSDAIGADLRAARESLGWTISDVAKKLRIRPSFLEALEAGQLARIPGTLRANNSAYQGYDKEHRNLEFPYKKPKNGKLTDEEKEYNRGLSGFRVRVEHRIGRTKRFKIASERFRNPLETHPTKISIIAGLVNLEDGFGPF